MNVSILVPGLLLFASVSCLGPQLKADFESGLKQWVGKPINEAIEVYGEPSKTTSGSNGGLIYTFETKFDSVSSDVQYQSFHNSRTGQTLDQQGAANAGSGQVAIRNETVTMRNKLFCYLIFETNPQGSILIVRYDGNNCW